MLLIAETLKKSTIVEEWQSLMIDYFIAMDDRRGRERINDITSISKANIDFAIPQSYAKAWFMKKYGESNDY